MDTSKPVGYHTYIRNSTMNSNLISTDIWVGKEECPNWRSFAMISKNDSLSTLSDDKWFKIKVISCHWISVYSRQREAVHTQLFDVCQTCVLHIV